MVLVRRLLAALRRSLERQQRARAALRAEVERELLGLGRVRTPRTDQQRVARLQSIASRRLRFALLKAVIKPFVMAALRQRYIALPELNAAISNYVSAKLDTREILERRSANRLRVALTVALALNTLEALAYASQRRRAALFDVLRANIGRVTSRSELAQMRVYGYANREELRKARREALLGTSFSKEIFKAGAFSTVNAVILAAMRANALTLHEYRKVRERANSVLNIARYSQDYTIPAREVSTVRGAQIASTVATAVLEPAIAASFRQERFVLPGWIRQVRRLQRAERDAAHSINVAMHRELLGDKAMP